MIHERRTALKGRVTRYLETGLGRPLILLHAFPLSADMWRPQLERAPRGWRIIAPDLRGLGGSELDGWPGVNVGHYAEDTLDLMDDLDLERAVIGGLSLGGYVTFAILRLALARVDGVILADTRSGADSEDGLKNRRALLEAARHQGAAAVAEQMIGKLIGETTRRERPDVIAAVRRAIESNRVEGIEAAIYALMMRPDSTADLATIRQPTLVLVGEEDTVTPLAEAQALQRSIAGSELAIVRRAGHLSNLEAPEDFSNTINTWLASLS